jgi:hypothetical protein
MGKKFGPYLKEKMGLKFFLKKALLKFFWGLIKKHFGHYLLGALGDGLSGLAIGPALPFRRNKLVLLCSLRENFVE